jgi:small subunit ribosomal protein S8e
MGQWHGISRRKSSGGRRVSSRGKRSTEISSEKQFALIGEPKRKIYRKTGGNTLVRVLSENRCTINGKDGKSTTAKITNVIQNDANSNYIRRNILTKGAVVETDKGQVKITSRPGHDGVLNGVVL